MFPTEFPLGILLMAAIVVIIVLYAILLIKLKPRARALEEPTIPLETKRMINRKPGSPAETQRSFRPKRDFRESASSAHHQMSVKPQKSLKEPVIEVENKTSVLTETHVETAETEETKEKDKDEEAKKSFFLFGERNFEGCPHKFGYLNRLPKNTPIPNECFGCPQIVECLRTLKTK